MKYDTSKFLIEAPVLGKPFNPLDIGNAYRISERGNLGPLVGCSLVIQDEPEVKFKGLLLTAKGLSIAKQVKLPFYGNFLPLDGDYERFMKLLSTGIRLQFVATRTNDLVGIPKSLFPWQANALLAKDSGFKYGIDTHKSKWIWRRTYLEYRPCKCGWKGCPKLKEKTGSIEDVTKVYELQTRRPIFSPELNPPSPEEVEEVMTDLDNKVRLIAGLEINHYSTPGEVAGSLMNTYGRENLTNLKNTYEPLWEELYSFLHYLDKAGLTQARRIGLKEDGYATDRISAYLGDLSECYAMTPNLVDLEKTTSDMGLTRGQILERLEKCLEVYCKEALIYPGPGQPPLHRHSDGKRTGLYTPPTPRVGFINRDSWLYEEQKGGFVEPLTAYWVYPKKGKRPVRVYTSLARDLIKWKKEIPYFGWVAKAISGKLKSSFLKKRRADLFIPLDGCKPLFQLPDGSDTTFEEILASQFNLATRVTLMFKSAVRMQQEIDLEGDDHCRAGIDNSLSLSQKGRYGTKLGDFRPPIKGKIFIVNDFHTSFPGDNHRLNYDEISLSASGKATVLEGPEREFREGMGIFSDSYSHLMPQQANEILGTIRKTKSSIPIGSIKTIGDSPTNEELRSGISSPRRLPVTKDELDILLSQKEEDDSDEE